MTSTQPLIIAGFFSTHHLHTCSWLIEVWSRNLASCTWINIGLENYCSPVRRQAITKYLNQWWLIVSRIFSNKLHCNANQIRLKLLQSFKAVHLKMPSTKWQPFFCNITNKCKLYHQFVDAYKNIPSLYRHMTIHFWYSFFTLSELANSKYIGCLNLKMQTQTKSIRAY